MSVTNFLPKIASILLFVFCYPAFALPVTWTLNNVVLSDGQTVTGSFVYNNFAPPFEEYSNISITTSGSELHPATTWDHIFIWQSLSYPHEIGNYGTGLFTSGPLDQTNIVLQLRWFGQLNPEGGTNEIATGSHSSRRVFQVCRDEPGGNCADTYNLSSMDNVYAVSGTIVGVVGNVVPIPAAAWLFASGLGLLGWMRRGIS